MYYLVNDSNKLNFLIDKILKNNTWIAIDTEFHSNKVTLYPVLSTIQICFPNGKTYVVDCIENNFNSNIEDFIKIIQTHNNTKVWFSAKQDLAIFDHLAHEPICNVFDIQIAVRALGYRENIGLGELYENLFNIKTNKKMQLSNWLHRPLSKKQIMYCFLDAYYIHKIYKKIYQKLEEKNLLETVKETMTKSYSESSFSYNINKELYKLKLYKKSQNEIALNLFNLRESIAHKYNISRKRILENRDIRNIALRQPSNSKELFKIRYSKQTKEYQYQILSIIRDVSLRCKSRATTTTP